MCIISVIYKLVHQIQHQYQKTQILIIQQKVQVSCSCINQRYCFSLCLPFLLNLPQIPTKMHVTVLVNIPYYYFCTLANIFPLHGYSVTISLTFKKFDQLLRFACNCPSLSRTLLVLVLKVLNPQKTLHHKQTSIVYPLLVYLQDQT